MIIQWLAGALSSVLTWLIGIFPAPTLPSWLTAAPSAISGWVAQLDGFGNWLPLDVVSGAVAFALVVLGIGGAIKLLRIIASFLSAGGGSAA